MGHRRCTLVGTVVRSLGPFVAGTLPGVLLLAAPEDGPAALAGYLMLLIGFAGWLVTGGFWAAIYLLRGDAGPECAPPPPDSDLARDRARGSR